MKSNKLLYPFKAIVSMLLFATIVWNLKLFVTQYVAVDDKRPAQTSLLILVWDWPFQKNPKFPGSVCYDLYGIENCQLTTNHSMFAQADVVVFHQRELRDNLFAFPRETRPLGQKWVWACLESPSNAEGLEKGENIFNWVLSYRQDSDIFVPYGKLVPHSPSTSFAIPNKTGLVSWVISNYNSKQERVVFYQKLSQHLAVDVYGKAAKKILNPKSLLPTISKYKFYLAFENSIHRDYITEKMWKNAFEAGAVPVVLGPPRANYEKFVPPNSFIHVEDFGSPEQLARFLRTMNSSRYEEFFQWREKYVVRSPELYTVFQVRSYTWTVNAASSVYPTLAPASARKENPGPAIEPKVSTWQCTALSLNHRAHPKKCLLI
ncbi:alpha-(1,3)-fucosyltransferase 7 [Rhinatrema bivittatum]|uniref:alpha-(1,3)-fucosyltransferase 7 n=1 Tax=Rhinatrema bivittatum TaxID=194408 RepID=UPI00112A889C|nr:alpha-(1,3)-fucosyltransferase 7 [Rhinatrema bivittatum]